MAKLKHDLPAERFYETGVSEGVLFVKAASGGTYGKGVAWNGLTAVTESPEGAEENAIYADNIKYLSLRSVEEFNCTIEAYTYPDEFEVCDGSAQLSATVPGVKLSQQPRRPFAFCYKSKKGNADNPELGYILHIIYGCTAAPAERAHETVNDSPDAMTMSWEVTTTPVEIEGFKPTAHLEIDSTKFDTEALKAKLQQIIDSLYGTDGVSPAVGTDPTLLMPDEILAILEAQ